MENRIAPAYVATLTGTAVVFAGDTASDTIIFSAVNGFLKHNRFTAKDAGFASDFDFDSTTAGVQMLAADPASSVAINLGTGTDAVILGGNQLASSLKASFAINNTGADGDTLEINTAAESANQNLDLSNNGAGSVLLTGLGTTSSITGDTFGKITLRTGTGNDQVSHAGALATLTIIETGAGNDTVIGSATTPLQIDGGAGSDTLRGSSQMDVIHGGPGNDDISGRQGNDLLFGDDGLDTFAFNPGDGSDTIDGGAGTDHLVFNGANIAENITLSALGNHFRVFRDVANITTDTVSVEQLDLVTLGGADTVNVSDLSGTSLKVARINFFGQGNIGDGQVDTLRINGTDFDDDLRVNSTATGVEVKGLGALIQLNNFETTDQLQVNGLLGTDNVFASSAALAKLAITLTGETASNAKTPVGFSTPASYDAGKSPSSIAAGNLFGGNGVISNDLVVADPKSNSILILPNGGGGTFTSAMTLSTGGKAPKGVVLGYFNSDSFLDIAVTNSGSGTVALFINIGNGTFQAPVLFAVGKTPSVLRAADLNNDGNLDLAMITGGNTVTTLTGTGIGTFNPPTKLSTGGKTPTDLALADFSTDGRIDLAVTNGGSNNISLLRANADFTYLPAVKTRVGTKPTAIAAADFDGDGYTDLAITHGVSRFVSVLLNANPTDVTTAFSSQVKLSHPGKNAPTAIAATDLDGDGRNDLIVANTAAGTASVFSNLGGALFRSTATFDLDNTPARKSSAIALADFDGDGLLDIAISNAGTGDVSVITRLSV